ncbi:transcriptional regulator [Nostoc sp. LEGE 12450]|uniref:transcriptional regulator n=1 Tax=Nostoc sp. LEGE 12450 TaxID=1828643 RepID=UPI00188068B6|nr:transcriptional regulator [Nostoc sp. LEGE 12450]MBE8990442.1 transcriptional regulator [Nostoc sp. LEGE 12450]
MSIKKPLIINQPEVGKLIRELRICTSLLIQEKFAASLRVHFLIANRLENGHAMTLLAMHKIETLLQKLDH